MRCIQNPVLFYLAGGIPEDGERDVATDDSTTALSRLPAGCAVPGQPSRLSLRGSLPLVDCDEWVGVVRPKVLGARTDQAIVIELLDHMGGPATYTGDGEDGRKQIDVNAQGVIGGSRVKVHIGIQLLVGLHELFNLVRDLKPFALPTCIAQVAGHGAEVGSAR